MQRDKFEECKLAFMQARAVNNSNDMVLWATELLMMDDQQAHVWAARGLGLTGMGFHLDATLNYDRALALESDEEQRAILYTNKAAAYFNMWDVDKALPCIDKAIAIHPIAQAYATLGNIYKHQGSTQKAIAAYRNCVDTDPSYADGHLMLGMMLLKVGALEEGWKEYEWRWKTNQLPPRKLKCPQWAGEDLNGKILLVYGEQGLGDIIQFARYARIIAEKFPQCKVIIEGRPSVKRLLETISETYSVINIGERLPAIDYAIPMLSLAGMLTPTINSIPSRDREYQVRYHDIECWADKLNPQLFDYRPGAFKVGLCWAGMSRDSNPAALVIDNLRSTTLNSFFPMLQVPNTVWVSLQKGEPASQLKEKLPPNILIGDFTEDMYDFYETACCIANCDLVISVDTAVAHVAASIGKPTWLLSRWDGCWRWFGDRSDSPWYPSLRQFAQPAPNDWDGMVGKVTKELANLAKNKNQHDLNLTMAK